MSKLDLSKPVQTRDGRKVRILCTDAKSGLPIVGLVSCCSDLGSPIEEIYAWMASGAVSLLGASTGADLINVPEKPRYRVALMKWHNGQPTGSTVYDDAGEAGIERSRNFIRWLTDWTEYDE
jgi:hypothetical protein